jgi:hypothetical protein
MGLLDQPCGRGYGRPVKRLSMLACAIVLAISGSADATVYTVGTTADPAGACPADPCSLRQLIARVQAAPFPPDVINVPAGTYTLDPALGTLAITGSMAIVGAGAGATTVAMPVPVNRASTGHRVFDVRLSVGAPTPTVGIRGMKITGGTAHVGNGFFGGNVQNAGTLTLTEVWVTDGSGYSGGGIANRSGQLTVERSLISGNRAPYGGGDSGGIQNFGVPASTGVPDRPGHLVINDSTITDNEARLVGGVFSWGDSTNTFVVNNSTIAGNRTQDEPGGGSRGGGGGLGVGEGTARVQNSIIAGNVEIAAGVVTKANCGPLGSGGMTSLGHNLESGTDCNFTAGGDVGNADPLLGPLQDNGGPTMTLGLPPGSPALDSVPPAACSPTDQRGVARPQGAACDIGAFELGVAPVNTAPPTIAGSTVVGETLTAGRGGWLYGPSGFALQWLRCDAAGGACSPISEATGVTYRLTASDAERTVRVSEAASNAFGGASATSAPTAVVTRPPRPTRRIRSAISVAWAVRGPWTTVTRVQVRDVPSGARVTLRCSGKGCNFERKRAAKPRRGQVNALKALKPGQRRLRAGQSLEVRITKSGWIGKAARYKMRWGRVPKSSGALCIPLGQKKPQRRC